jgi:hypothetical protein
MIPAMFRQSMRIGAPLARDSQAPLFRGSPENVYLRMYNPQKLQPS